MSEQYYNLPMVKENFLTRNVKKLVQSLFSLRRRKRNQRRAPVLAVKAKKVKSTMNAIEVEAKHKKVDIFEFQDMYRRGEIAIQSMNDDQKYALIRLFEMQNERLRESIETHKKNTDAYNAEVERLKRELDIIK